MFGGGSPPRNGGDGPITPLWQQQIAKADVSPEPWSDSFADK
jgi:hypothetical protein